MIYRHTRSLSWEEWRAAVKWIFAHWDDVTVLAYQPAEPLDKAFLILSTIGIRNKPDNLAYSIKGPEDLVVEYIMRWG